ncbi:ScbR family autoregulator-binding transcription factor [Streptomyces sp. NPDC047028]|uniref:ScbR family autoregulator-binding transcription factor n=1 Tax=Streptomyces sp. NPDC047028 TaxID=3155793 RepID=UPI0033F6A025
MAASSTPASWAKPAESAVARGPEPRQDRAIRTRNLVLFKAAELFAEHGFKDTSMKDVAERAGMTKGAVYHHYPSKESLAVAVVEAHYGRWPTLLEGAQRRGLGPMDTLVAMFDGCAEAFHGDTIVQGGARLQIERSLIDVPLPTPYVGWTELATDLFGKAAQAGELREGVDPASAARTLVAAFFGLQHISDTLTRRRDLLERWAEMRELLLYAVRA